MDECKIEFKMYVGIPILDHLRDTSDRWTVERVALDTS